MIKKLSHSIDRIQKVSKTLPIKVLAYTVAFTSLVPIGILILLVAGNIYMELRMENYD